MSIAVLTSRFVGVLLFSENNSSVDEVKQISDQVHIDANYMKS